MTKKLEEVFGFESTEDIDDAIVDEKSDITLVHNPEEQISEETGVSDHEEEMNQIFAIALDAHKKTMEFGLGVEAKNSSPGLSASTSYLNIALNASKSKVDKKLSLARIKLEKEKLLNQSTGSSSTASIETENAEGDDMVAGGEMKSRNDIIKELKLLMEATTNTPDVQNNVKD